jgi:hypothetical protein
MAGAMSDDDEVRRAAEKLRADIERQKVALGLLESLVRLGSDPRGADPAAARAVIEEFGFNTDTLEQEAGGDPIAMIGRMLREIGLDEAQVAKYEAILRQQMSE